MKAFLQRRNSRLEQSDAKASSSSPDARSVSPLTAQTLVEQAEEGEQEDMFANRGINENGRSLPAHLRTAFAQQPSAQAWTPNGEQGLKPSERFARPERDLGCAEEMPLFKQQQPSISAGTAASRPPETQQIVQTAKPERKKSSLFSIGSKKSLPPVPKPLAPTISDSAPRYESRSLPVMSSTIPSKAEPSLAMSSAPPAPSTNLSAPGADLTVQRSHSPPTYLMTGYTQPGTLASFPAYVAPSGSHTLPRSASQPFKSSAAEALSSTVPRSVSQSGRYSPMAAFLGTTGPSVSSSSSFSVPSPKLSNISPASLSDAETGRNVLTNSPTTSLSTPATSDGGHAEPTPKSMVAGKAETRTLEDILSRYAPRPMASAPGASADSAALPATTSAPVSSPSLTAPIMTSYLYATSPPLVPKMADESLANSRALPAGSSFAKTGFAAMRERTEAPEDTTTRIQHSTSVQSNATIVQSPSLPTLTPSTSDNFLAGTSPSPVRTSFPAGAGPAWTQVRLQPTLPASEPPTASGLVTAEPEQPAARLANPFATMSTSYQRSQVELAQPKPLGRGEALTVGVNGLHRQANGTTPIIETTPDLVPYPSSPDQVSSTTAPAETSMTRLSVASREARERLTNLYAEMNVTAGRASPAESKMTAPTDSSRPSSEQVLQSPFTGPLDSSSSSMIQGGSDGDVSGFDTSSRISSIDAPAPRLTICIGNPRFEHALSKFPRTIFSRFIDMMEWADLRALREVSRALRFAFDVSDTREYILERYLGKYGYRTLPSSDFNSTHAIDLSLRDLESFLTGREFAPAEFAELAREHMRKPLDYVTVRMINSSMRAWNRVVMRCRTQGAPFARPPPGVPSVYKDGRAACLRVWVPLRDGHWMQDDEVVQCEKEVWRSGVWSLVQKGDVVWNVAQGDFANEGKLISDSKFLRDLVYLYDHNGHLPPWLNGMTFSPGFWHNVLFSSDPNHPVIYTSLAPWAQQIQDSLVLCKENVSVNQNAGRYRIQRYVYRAHAELKVGTLIGAAGSDSGNGPGGIDCIHQDWAGHLYVETEGSTEHAQDLVRRCASKDLLPFRILREKSRPGKIVIRPVFESEKIS